MEFLVAHRFVTYLGMQTRKWHEHDRVLEHLIMYSMQVKCRHCFI